MVFPLFLPAAPYRQPYLSPEQVNKLPYGIEADMWAAGVVVSELLMGVTVFWWVQYYMCLVVADWNCFALV